MTVTVVLLACAALAAAAVVVLADRVRRHTTAVDRLLDPRHRARRDDQFARRHRIKELHR